MGARRRRAEGPEQQLQRRVVQYLRLVNPAAVWFSVPMGGWRSKTEAAIMKGLGAKAGVADLVFLHSRGALCIELKRPDGKGRQSPAQKRFHEECEAAGVGYVIAASVEEVEGALFEAELIPRRRTV